MLKDASKELGNSPLKCEDKDVVFRCWLMLAEALRDEVLDAGEIESSLKDTPCVPNPQNKLYPPSWMVLEDRPGLAAKFPEQLRNNSIPRLERAWPAMKAAGVRPISTVVVGCIDEPINPSEDETLKNRIAERKALIKTLLEGTRSHEQSNAVAIQFDSVRFFPADELKVKWHLNNFAPQKSLPSVPEPVSAYLNRQNQSIYFTRTNGNTEWSAIARALTLAIAPGEEIQSLSPGLKMVLEADSLDHAIDQLHDLGIPVTKELSYDASGGSVAESFDEASTPAQPQELPTPSQDVTNNLPAESPPASLDDEHRPSSDLINGAPLPTPPAPAPTGTHRRPFGRDHDEGHSTDPTSQNQIEQEPEPSAHVKADGPLEPFATLWFQPQTIAPSAPTENPVWFPEGGQKTENSAEEQTRQSNQSGRAGAQVRKSVTRWEPTEAAKELADKFKSMTKNDYANRCQICGTTFEMRNRELQLFVVHLVEPSKDSRTNHLGNLLGLCGVALCACAIRRVGFVGSRDKPTN